MQGYKDGKFLKDPESRGKSPANPMTDPAAMEGMMGMMKGNMMMMIPQTLIMSWINAFFSGFVVRTYGSIPRQYLADWGSSKVAVSFDTSIQVDVAERYSHEGS